MKFKPVWILAAFASIISFPAITQPVVYPTKTIKIILPFPGGSTGDTFIRPVAAKLSEKLGQSVIVEARPGAAGAIGTTAVANAAPDGYTLLFNTSSLIVNQVTQKNAVDVLASLIPISPVANGALGIYVNASLPVKTLPELIAYARANPGKLRYATSGIGSITHLYGEMLKSTTGIDMVHVPYNGGAAALLATMKGEVQVHFTDLSSGEPQVDAGTIRLLAVTTPNRVPQRPDIPTVAETGVPTYPVSDYWWGLFAPKGTPDAVIARLNTEIREILAEPDIKKSWSERFFSGNALSPEDFSKVIGDFLGAVRKVVAEAKLKFD